MMSSRNAFRFLLALVVAVLFLTFTPNIYSQISITATGASYSENFDGMGPAGTTYLTGWAGYRYGGSGTIGPLASVIVDDGTLNSGNVYNYGASGGADRALGMLASGSTYPRIGAQFVNNTGVTITIINFAGLMKQWRSGSSNTANEVDAFEISFDATSLVTGTWTPVTGMDLLEKLTSTTSAAKVDGNNIANQTSISASVNGLNWTNGTTMWIRWSDVDNSGSDCALSIDNLTMSFNVAPIPPGRGSAFITPSPMHGTESQTITVGVAGESPYTITNVNVVIPPLFTWSHSAGDVTIEGGGGSPSAAVSGDTIEIIALSLVSINDTVRIHVAGVTPPDSTDVFAFPTQTGTQPDSMLNLQTMPTVLVYGSPRAIGDIKSNDVNGIPVWNGKWVTILGVVTVGAEFGSPSYIQDATGGIAVYGVITSSQVAIGDEVQVVGQISPFNGLTELNSPILIQKVSTGNTVTPLELNCHQVTNDGVGGLEQYEGLLVRVNQVTVTDLNNNPISSWAVSGSGTNYKLHDVTDTLQVRVDNNVNFANTPSPGGTFDIIGVVSQFKSTSPFIGGYQLMPRSTSDILSQGPIFATSPVESNLQPTSMRISWTTVNNGTTRVKYGLTTAYELGIVSPDNTLRTDHAVDLTGLTPATIYHVQAFSDGGANDTSFAGDLVVSSAAAAGTTGQMNVYFNKSIDASASFGETAQGNVDFIAKVLTRINNAHRSIDAALYSLSGSAQGDAIASALVSAKGRGVSVRVICEADNQSGGSFGTLSSAGIPVINDKFDAVWNGAGLMHNKFFVFDGRGGAPPESIWVWSGSWNPTYPGTTADRQNVIEIQDGALAGAYTTEFNHMWGSTTSVPNASSSRFGARKLDVVPHNFNINNVPVSVYFSPSDHTTSKIVKTMGKAQHSISTAVLTFTRKDIADTMIAQKNGGDKVRIVVDNNTDQGNQFSYLQSNGIDIHLKGFSNGLLHHKYTVVDGEQVAGTDYLMTGSHNYSNSAEQSNDENMLIVQSNRVANLYLQEFAARYYEAGGTDSIHVTSGAIFSIDKNSIAFDTVLLTQSKTDSFSVTNSGNASLVISPIPGSDPQFTVTPDSATVAPLGTQKFHVTFAPTAIGPQAATMVLSFNASGSPDTVHLTGVGKSGFHPIFSVTPSALNFGSMTIGTTANDTFTISNTGTADLYVTSITSNVAEFTTATANDTIAQGNSKKYTVTFSPVVAGVFNGKVTIVHSAEGSPDSVMLHGVGEDTTTTRMLAINAGWNLVSLPLRVPDARRTTLFPTSASRVFRYGGSYFVPLGDSLEWGYGYWVRFDSAVSQPIVGLPIWSDTVQLFTNWNMIGTVTNAVSVGSVIASQPGLIISNFFSYDGAYIVADSLRPGYGYWVRTNGAGWIVLQSEAGPGTLAKQRIAQVEMPSNILTVTDAGGRSQKLYFGEGPTDGKSLMRYDLPPAPPEGAFNVRFSSGRMAEAVSHYIIGKTEFPMILEGMKYPVRLDWAIDSKDTKYYTLLTNSGNATPSIELKGTGSATLRGGEGVRALAVANEKGLPAAYALLQNYPNPFNPATTIAFDLPKASVVTLAVYNVLGERVATLADGASYEGGTYGLHFDATTLASGVYYYQLIARSNSGDEFRQVRKLVVMK